MKKRTLISLTILAHLSYACVHAAIVVGSTPANPADINGDTSMTLDIDAGSDVVLLLSLTRRNSLAPTVTLDWTGGTGVAVTELVTVDAGTNRSNSIFGIELGTVGAVETVTFNFDTSDGRAAATGIQLLGATLTGYGSTSDSYYSNGTLTGDLTGVAEGSFVFANMSNATPVSTLNFSAPSEVQFSELSTGRDSHRSAYDLDVAAGTYSVSGTVAGAGGADFSSLTAVSIVAIPEPGTLALVGVAGICALAFIRNRKS